MSSTNFLDQDFGAESDDDVNFNPAPAEDSDNEVDEVATTEVQQSRSGAANGSRQGTAENIQGDQEQNDTYSNGHTPNQRRRRDEEESLKDVRETIENTEPTTGEIQDGGEDLEDDEGLDDEEDDEDAGEDEEEVTGHRRKRRKDRGVQGLFDVEAEVDEDEDELEDEDDELKEADGFIADTHPDDLADFPTGADTDDRRHRELDRRREVEASQDAERQAEALRKRYRRSRAVPTDSIVIPKRLLLPSVDDPSIWGVKCKPGKEREIILGITKRIEERAQTRVALAITSAFERGGTMAGYIYVEARKQSDVFIALEGLSNVYPRTKMVLVPIKEMPDLLRTTKSKDIEPGSYVRIKRGKYQGDLAQVDTVVPSGLEVGLRIVPRLDYGLNEDVNAPMVETNTVNGVAGKRKRVGITKAKSLASRPPARLFSEVDARKKHAKYLHPGPNSKNTWMYLSDTYRNGFLEKDFKINHLQLENVNPTLEEVTKFASGAEDGTENLDLNALAANLRVSTANATYIPGDMVEVYDGEQRGVSGKVLSVLADIVTINVTEGELRGRTIEVPVRGLRKQFREGDHVKVIGGSRFRDEVGMVVKISDDKVTVLSDVNMNEITVFNKDLRKATDSGKTGALGRFDLYDLVQLDPATVGAVVKVDRESLRVLDQNGSIRSLMPSQISNKLERRRHTVATDRNGSEIRAEDTVREIGGEGKQGTIMHIHRSFLFLHNREQTEDAGMFVARTSNVATVAAKGGRLTGNVNAGPDLTRMNPALQRNGGMNGSMLPPAVPKMSGRDRTVGKTVTIRRGPYKGLLGIVKDATDSEARVELHTNSKTITVSKDSLGIKDLRTGQVTGFSALTAGGGRGAGRGGYGGATPARNQDEWQGSRTPMAAALQESRTPSWQGGGRTPAWSGVMAHSGRTPAWKQDQMGGRTPAYGLGDGGRTPYGIGNRTPAWNAGGQTPYGGRSGYGDSFGAGSKTPLYGSSETWNGGARTSNNGRVDNYSGSRTPGYGGNDALAGGSSIDSDPYRGSRGYEAPTPGADMAAPTPGAMNAPTPGSYSAAPTPVASGPAARSGPSWNGTNTYAGDSAPTPGANAQYAPPTPGAMTGGGSGGGKGGSLSSSTRPGFGGYYDGGAPTPGAYGNPETPGNWKAGNGNGDEDDDDDDDDDDGQPRYSTPSP